MDLVRINRSPSPKDLRVFAVLWLVFFGIAALIAGHRGWPALAGVAGTLAVLVGAPGLVRPSWVKGVYVGACYAALPIGFVVSHLLLAVIYFLVITPVGLVLRLARHDPLQRKFQPGASTYWTRREPRRPPESYLRQH